MLTGKDREDWIKEQYRKYRRRQYMALGLIAIGVGVIVIAALIPTAWLDQLPILLRQAIGWSLIGSFVGCFGGGFEFFTAAEKLLPPVEDRALYRLKSTIVNLKAYASHGDEAYKEKGVRDLGRVADTLDTWEWGNLKFIREGVGKEITEFRKNFRGRLIPAIKNANGMSMQSFFMSLTNVENILEMGQLDHSRFTLWNQSLSRFTYYEPSPSLSKRLMSKKSQLAFLVVLVTSPLVTYYIALDISHTTVDTAFSGAAIVFAGVLAALVSLGVLTLGRKRPSASP